jgi:DNA helicase MCM9
MHRIPLGPLHGRNIILKSVCPQLHGLKTVKLAFLLALLGGVPRSEPDGGATVRGDSHLLIVGDPGMGKSQLLRYAAQVAPRSVLTSGVGSTAAGLTAAAVKCDGSEGWMLDAGALVLADGGICCIDEFDTISTGERAAIHEAMEQQTVSFAKGSIVATLQTRCSVFGATNPRGMKIDPNESLSHNTGLAPPLLSRFDCVFILQDDKDPDQDKLMSAHMLASYCAESLSSCKVASAQANVFPLEDAVFVKKRKTSASDIQQGTLRCLETAKSTQHGSDRNDCTPEDHLREWSFDRLRRYISLARCALKPKLTPEAEALIRGYFQLRRQQEDDPKGRPTIRLIESLIRLTQAHARLMWMDEALPRDVIVAIEVIESSNLDGARNETNERDPEEYYRHKERRLIKKISKCV